jgi:hypothetical protein
MMTMMSLVSSADASPEDDNKDLNPMVNNTWSMMTTVGNKKSNNHLLAV